jgi:glutamate-1-semialdehyde 2,1-aminomutase
VVCTGAGMPSNDRFVERSRRAIPGGVNSSIRAFAAVGGRPYVVARAEGPYVWDVEGTRYIDLVQSYGAVILGHAHPAITAAVRQAAGRRHLLRSSHPSRDEAGRGDPRAGALL